MTPGAAFGQSQWEMVCKYPPSLKGITQGPCSMQTPRVPNRLELQQLTEKSCLITQLLLAAFPFCPLHTLLLLFPGIASQINYTQWNHWSIENPNKDTFMTWVTWLDLQQEGEMREFMANGFNFFCDKRKQDHLCRMNLRSGWSCIRAAAVMNRWGYQLGPCRKIIEQYWESS